MKLTRHNGRAGKHGAYNPKHNDRDFELGNSEHIDEERARQNIYWDCYQGFRTQDFLGEDGKPKLSFEKIEQIYYRENYGDYVDAQNERNEQNRHTERNRTVEDVLKNTKTCPEETVYQIGNIDASVTGETLCKVSVELMQQIEEKFGEQVHIIDWALHLDEATPHIHERHVFDCDNSYGEKCPQQEKALEMLGFQLPDPDKKKGRNNNRKMSFDAECRKMFFEICDKYGLQLDKNPEYGGRDYLEKQDFIIENQKRKMETQEQALEQISMKLEDAEALVDEIAENAYQKACEVVTEVVSEETRKKDIEAVSEYRNWYNKPERKVTPDQRKLANKILEHVEIKLNGLAKKILKKVQEVLQSPAVKEQSQNEIKEHAKKSLREHIKIMKQKSAEQDKDRKSTDLPNNKQQNIGIE